MAEKTNLSGRNWWDANQAKYANSRDLDALDASFKERVEGFIKALRNGGATVVISATRRSAQRAYLMHYSWEVAHGSVAPADVPPKSGVSIDWDHGDLDASRKAAEEMVKAFGMAYTASLTSNHIAGKAVDMTISWKSKLILDIPLSCGVYEIADPPRTGQNRELWRYAEDYHAVKKLPSDPPHWSFNGR